MIMLCSLSEDPRICSYATAQTETISSTHTMAMSTRVQWRSKALRGPGSTVTWGPSIHSAGPQGLKLEDCFLLLSCQFFLVFHEWRILFLRKIFWPRTRGPQELGASVH